MNPRQPAPAQIAIGDVIPVRVTGIAHGGTAVGRAPDDRVVFVRGAIPGESVQATVTAPGRKGRSWFATATSIDEPSPDRVEPPCPVADLCGGCDFQHVSWGRQRALKRQVLREQLQRIAGIDRDVPVLAVGDSPLGWRTRLRLHAGPHGWGLREHRSHEVVALAGCPVATPEVSDAIGGAPPSTTPDDELIVAGPGDRTAVLPSDRVVSERVGDHRFAVGLAGFWQAHRLAPQVLCAAVAPHVSDVTRWWDLYAGVGLFAGTLARTGQQVIAVEGDRRAAALLADNVPAEVRAVRADVAGWLRRDPPGDPEVVVVDPPRSGAGRDVVAGITASTATTTVLVSCDPAALARDLGDFVASGWTIDDITGYDVFPMTHHVEAVAVVSRARRPAIN